MQRGDELELNRRTNNDNQVKPIEDMSTLQLSPNEEPVTQLGNQLSSDNQSRIQRTI